MKSAEILDYEDVVIVDVSKINWQKEFEEGFPLNDELKDAIQSYKAGEGPAPRCLIRKFADSHPTCVIFVDKDNPYNALPVSN